MIIIIVYILYTILYHCTIRHYLSLAKSKNLIKKLENKRLPEDLDYSNLKGISLEARQKLNQFKPVSIGQASRISGVSPADVNVLMIFLDAASRREKAK